ncbi:phenylacetate--CoA ligase family protein [Gudongella sp. SC589]|uniref:hypothetical protein n=1 Tax=Gudongella sp. SC589 TaxID=3385990 RepID=UPI0039046868
MRDLIFKIYLNSPFILKRLFANIEGIRRDFYRKGKKKNVSDENHFRNLFSYESNFDLKRIQRLFNDASKNVEYYSFLKDLKVSTQDDFKEVPVLTKDEIRGNKDSLISKKTHNKRELWNGSSSGSTGTPLKYYRDRNSVLASQLNNTEYYRYCGCDINSKKVRISGVKITSFNREKPPFWIYIDKYKQLQCSTYHISKNSYREFLKQFERVGATYGTGFPSGWYALAELMDLDNKTFEKFDAIITDSEGINDKQRKTIEKVFKCPVYSTYGLGEVGMFAVECEFGNYHIIPTHYVEVLKSNGDIAPDGEIGEIVVTDYNSSKFPYIRYATGDLGILKNNNSCKCNMKTPYLTEIIGRVEDYVLTKDGRKITRLTQIVKPAIGIKASQIIQNSKDNILIKVVPAENFDPQSMELVLNNAKEFVGDMNITWDKVESLEKMPSGKVKFVIRKI